MIAANEDGERRARAGAGAFESDDPAAAAVRMVASTSAFRYLHITIWAIFLLTLAPLPVVAVWYIATMGVGMLRSRAESAIKARIEAEGRRLQRVYAFIAMFSCSFWAAAPVIAWTSGHPFGEAGAAFLVVNGFMLALSQFRASPANALIVTAPYTAVFLYFVAASLSGPLAWALLAAAPVLAASISYPLIFGWLLQKDMQRAQNERRILIHQLEEAKLAAERASEAKSMFLANMSHEIRTPMNGVLGMAELLAQTRLDTRQKLYADTIHKSGGALLTIINDILDFSKIEAGRLELDLEPFDLRCAVEDVAALIAPRAHEKGIEIVVRLQPDLAQSVVGDAGRIRQILTNLVGNAIKFTSEGYVLVNVSGASENGEAALRIEVADTGIGIPADKAERIFDAFQQADASTTREFGGTGLGLSICKRLVAAMNGEIGVVSKPGEGSTFWFTLTLPVDEQAAPRTEVTFNAYGKRVLVVDDIEVNRQITGEQLGVWGFSPDVVESGEAALEALRAASEAGRPYDLAIIDYLMPEMDGEELARRILEDETLRETPVMVLSSVDADSGPRIFRDIGVKGYLVKPVRSSLLIRTIGEILGEISTPADDPEAPQESEPEQSECEGLRVLLAEDNEVNQLVIKHMLRPANAEIVVAANGQEALDAYADADGEYDLILMDVSMPVMDGYEASRRVRALETERGYGETPIICLTAHVLSQDVEASLDAGMNDFIAKPVNQTRLLDLVRQWTSQIEWDDIEVA